VTFLKEQGSVLKDQGKSGSGRSRAGTGTLADRVVRRDRHRFVGRDAELEFLESCLGDEPPASVVLIHGPGGIGKSTLLRELGRRADAHGCDTFFVEGRELPPMPDALEAVLAGARASKRPVDLIDT
jgi:predicted ATP-dependent serine protease